MKLQRLRSKTNGSRLEAKFALYWRGLSGPELQREFVFHAERKWRADFAHVASKTIFEIEGGVFIKGGGRHNRAAGFIADATKHIEAFLAGWSVVRLTEEQITTPIVERIIRLVRERAAVDIGTKAYVHSPSTSAPRSHALEHERTHPSAEHPGIADAQSDS